MASTGFQFSVVAVGVCRALFTDILWPDFDGDALDTCLLEYAGRERRFGKTSEQVRVI